MQKKGEALEITRRGFMQAIAATGAGIACGSGLHLFSGNRAFAAEAGSVTHYIATPVVFQNPVVAIFNKDYPNLKVNLERNDTYVLYQKIVTEANAGRINGDVCGLTDLLIMKDLQSKGILANYTPPNDNDYPAAFKVKGYIYPYYLMFVNPIYNTKLVSKEEAPQSWTDLLNPKWKGKMCSTTPTLGGTSWILYYFLRKQFGLEYWKNLAKQDVTIYDTSATAASQKVITGEHLLLIDTPHLIGFVHRKNKEPIDLSYPKEGVPFSMEAEGLLKGAPNSEGGKTYLNWLLSKKGQTAMCLQNGLYSALEGIPNAEGMAPKDKIKIWYPDWEEWGRLRTEWVNEWKEIFKR